MKKLDTDIKVGSVVILNHGGPLMTVTRIFERIQTFSGIDPNQKETFIDIECAWFNGNDQPCVKWFPEHSLRVRKDLS